MSEASSPCPVQTEARRAAEGQPMGRFFFGSVSFVRTKEMNSPMKGEKTHENSRKRIKKYKTKKNKQPSRAPTQKATSPDVQPG
ncbi:MAG TPA: hypothetical protein ENH39_07830 [Gammaproteobacteria bacterium]|nr:hypothetical protein [Gammaproteobacteria bacterium]